VADPREQQIAEHDIVTDIDQRHQSHHRVHRPNRRSRDPVTGSLDLRVDGSSTGA
jgi:hypothetical protein